MLKKFYLLFILLSFIWKLGAQDDPKPVTNTFVIQNATIVTSPGKKIEKGSILIKNGLIQAVGNKINIPFDAKIIKADSMFVYAGFIDGASHVGIPKPQTEQRRPEVKDPANPPNDIAGIQPERMVRDVIKADEKSIEELRGAGFTMSHVLPEGRMLPGKGAIVLLGGKSINDLIFLENTALFMQFQSARGVFPATLIGVISKFEELYLQAKQSYEHEKMYRANPTGMKRPEKDAVLEAFFPVIEQKQHIFMKTESSKEISRALTLQKELGYAVTLVELKEGTDYADKLKNVNLFLSLNLPKEVKIVEKKDSIVKAKTWDELEKEQLEKRQKEVVDQREQQAAQLAAKGLNFGFSTLGVKPKEAKTNLMRMITAGLSEDVALAALTTHPAKMLGIDKVAGTIEKGKMANLLISDAPFFDEASNVRYVFVDGQLFEYEAKPKKKAKAGGEEEKPMDISGAWTYETSAGGMDMSGQLVLEMKDDDVSGTMSNPMNPTEKEEIKNASLSGKTLEFEMNVSQGGQSLKVVYELTFDEDSYEGTMSVGQYGSFKIKGTKLNSPK